LLLVFSTHAMRACSANTSCKAPHDRLCLCWTAKHIHVSTAAGTVCLSCWTAEMLTSAAVLLLLNALTSPYQPFHLHSLFIA
jgi:hypothetical protein